MPEQEPQITSLSPVKQALHEIRELRSKVKELEESVRCPIAIVGVGMRFPGGINDEISYWELLQSGRDAITEIPHDRWDWRRFFDQNADAPGKMYTKFGGFIDDVYRFDAEFFGVSPREAINLDPQQRMLLQVSWEALENAGQAPEQLKDGSTGVFFGVGNHDYLRSVLANDANFDAYVGSGNSPSMSAARLSYFLGLHGPSIVLDTSCSSSLVAVHAACASIRNGECDLALAGGISLILAPEMNIAFSKARMMSRDGRCKTFDAAADGYVRSEGCGVVVLRKLNDAITRRDRIIAVIRGSAVNHDGRSGGLTAPSGPAQTAVIRGAFESAGVPIEDLGYVEAHGTGTSLGDPIEIAALGASLAGKRAGNPPVTVGSVKTNIGHAEAASGIAGLLKVALSLQHKQIPPHLHMQQRNPLIEWDELPIAIPTKLEPWRPIGGRRIGSVSSFGFSGTNAHVVLEEAPVLPHADFKQPRAVQILPLSARSQPALDRLRMSFSKRLATLPPESLADLSATAAIGRTHFTHRFAAVGNTCAQLKALLDNPAQNRISGLAKVGVTQPQVCFLYPGKSARWGTGRELYDDGGVFRIEFDRCNLLFADALPVPLNDILYGGSASLLDDSAYAGPVLLALEYALSALWQSWGVIPAVVSGDGAGEYAAACVSGIFSLEDAVALLLASTNGMEANLRHSNDLNRINFKLPRIPITSSLTGEVTDDDSVARSTYWLDCTRRLSGFEKALESVRKAGCGFLLEIGSEGQFDTEANTMAHSGPTVFLSSLRTSTSDWQQMFESLGQLYVAGQKIRWEAVSPGFPQQRMALPTYPFAGDLYRVSSLDEISAPEIWSCCKEAAEEQSDMLPIGIQLDRMAEMQAFLEQLSMSEILAVFAEAGIFQEGEVRYDLNSVMERGAFLATHERLIERWLRRLASAGHLIESQGAYIVSQTPLALNRTDLWSQAASILAADLPLFEYLRSCSNKLLPVLRGTVSPLETLFPGGSDKLALNLYEQSPGMQYANRIVASVVRAACNQRGSRSLRTAERIRILEVGAGTGATTAAILRELSPDSATYRFTDVSDLFLERSRRRFSNYDYVTFDLLNVELDRDVEKNRERFDVIVAANVIHATADLQLSCKRLASMLAPGGTLILSESTKVRGWHDISTGLIEGWQRYDDTLRPDGPLVDEKTWHGVLLTSGFVECRSFPEADSAAAEIGVHIILARASPNGNAHRADIVQADEASIRVHSEVELPTGNLHSSFRIALPQERIAMLLQLVREQAAHILRIRGGALPGALEGFMDLGMDSLMAVEFRNRLGAILGVEDLPATMIFDYPTPEALSQFLSGLFLNQGPSDMQPSATLTGADSGQVGAELEGLSDIELGNLLQSALEGRRR